MLMCRLRFSPFTQFVILFFLLVFFLLSLFISLVTNFCVKITNWYDSLVYNYRTDYVYRPIYFCTDVRHYNDSSKVKSFLMSAYWFTHTIYCRLNATVFFVSLSVFFLFRWDIISSNHFANFTAFLPNLNHFWLFIFGLYAYRIVSIHLVCIHTSNNKMQFDTKRPQTNGIILGIRMH